jgi:hypothetical protein
MAVQPYSTRAPLFAPGEVPKTGNPELESYIAVELEKMFQMLSMGMVQMLIFEPLGAIPPRVFDGMVCFFRENVITPQRGLYEYRSGAWSKL